jgi:hypothetical protein
MKDVEARRERWSGEQMQKQSQIERELKGFCGDRDQ